MQQAEAQLISSRENYVAVVGSPPVALEQPPALPKLPASPNEAVSEALNLNPNLIAARRQADATRYDINVARANRLPKLSAVDGRDLFHLSGFAAAGIGGAGRAQFRTAATAGLQFSLPIFQGGRPAAQVRQAEAQRSQALEAVTATERNVIAQARSAYAVWQSSQQVIASSETAVKRQQAEPGGRARRKQRRHAHRARDSERRAGIAQSQVTLVSARRDAYVAGFALLAAMGHAEARDLGLRAARCTTRCSTTSACANRINDFAGDGEPEPVATSTAQTPAQTATVARNFDPMLDTPVDRSPALTTGASSPNRQ